MKILSIVPFPPRLDATHGGGKATANLLLKLAERHPLALVHLRSPHEPPADPALLTSCDFVEEIRATEPDTRFLRRRLRKILLLARGNPLWAIDVDAATLAPTVAEVAARWSPDVVQIEFAVALDAAWLLPSTIPLVLVDHEPGVARAEGELTAEDLTTGARLLLRADLRAWRRFEQRALEQATAIVVFTDRDRDILARTAPKAAIHVIPLGISIPAVPLDAVGAEQAVVFVGSFVHPPNVDAALHLVRDILPRVRRRHPGVRTYIVGDRPPPELLALAEDDVVVTGWVESVEPYLDGAAVVVAPLHQGGGMRVKVLEALAAGKALVATPLAIAGLDVTNGKELLIACAADTFADAVSSLLANPEQRAVLARNATAWAHGRADWETVARSYERLYASILSSSRA